ncbi:Acetyltransferase (GNAT) family protein [Rhodovulum sp. ES.010]|uniref:GNAT family N-acetyltransferase n=1 Tax=Rhodovulum sp. ES.010 TaxID=1882821 RepID=UPI0009269D4B|nr:GNAT family N-acetyltransferase [Rhodovulum sp. ES.010]SIO34654.1 Acetyltransferase (GNAT) family protein [Rhodovulum sp. ES.010]
MTETDPLAIEIGPATWPTFEAVMGANGGCGGCWCMLWRRTAKEMEASKGDGNRRAMRKIFEDGAVPGLVAMSGDAPAGWIQIDRRAAFPRLASSRVLKPVDDEDVWSVSCFFIEKRFRRQGLSRRLLRAAVDWAGSQGAPVVEGYPIDTPRAKYPPVYAWTGFAQAFRDAGFVEVARRSETRPIMRKRLAPTNPCSPISRNCRQMYAGTAPGNSKGETP